MSGPAAWRKAPVARFLAVGALAIAAIVVAVLILQADRGYRVQAELINASQLVKGNEVRVAGEPVGTVEEIELTDDGQALVALTIDEDYAPLREGTRAVVRQASLSGVANRYIDLHLAGGDAPPIEDGGRIRATQTRANVDIDELFNVFDPPAREGFRDTIALFSEFNAGREEEANEALRRLSPSLALNARLFRELDRSTPDLERFIVETSQLVTDLAARDDDLAGVVTNLATTLDALGDRRAELGTAVEELPPFLRRANTTFVNLRATLDALDPLVADARPVVRSRLRPLFAELRPFARDAAPTLRDLSRTISRPGTANDLIEFLRAQPAVDRIANRTARRNGAQRPGAFRATRSAVRGATPQLAFFRPYTNDLVGWFDDFSSSGVYDALGGFSRSGIQLNQFSFTPAAGFLPVPPELRDELLEASVDTGRNSRCPGSIERPAEDGSNPYRPSPDFNCDPRQQPIGP